MPRLFTIATAANNNDIYLDGVNNIALKEDAEALANIVLNRAQTATGELQYDLRAGIPYFTTVFASPPDLQMFGEFIKADASSIPEVIRVRGFALERDAETLVFRMELSTTFGELVING